MTSSPDLIHELRASRPTAPAALRARVREISARETAPAPWARFRFPVRRAALIAVPAAAALAFASAGVLGLARSDGPTEAFRDEHALDLTRSLGGHVVSASVATGDEGSATLTVRVPVAKVQEAIVRLSALGRIVSQQVTIDDLQESLDALERRAASVRNQIARIAARLESESLDAETRAVLENRLKTLRTELRELRRGISATNAEARMSTIQLTVVTPGAFGAVAPPARLDRTIDKALNVLVWEGVIVLAVLIVLAPFALVAFAAWLGRRFYRRREEERLLAT